MNQYHSLPMLAPKTRKRTTMAPGVSIVYWLLVLLPAALACSCVPQRQAEQPVAPTPAATLTPAAQPGAMYPPGYGPAVPGKPYSGSGIVKIVDRKEWWVEIEHGEIKDLMPAMTMAFWIRNRSLLKDVQVGDKVDFVLVEDSKSMYLTELKRVAPGP